MSIGSGIFLIVVGAILAFAVNVEVEWVNLDLIGYIMMGAGVVVLLLGMILLARRRRTDVVTSTQVDPGAGEQVTRRSTTSSGDAVM